MRWAPSTLAVPTPTSSKGPARHAHTRGRCGDVEHMHFEAEAGRSCPSPAIRVTTARLPATILSGERQPGKLRSAQPDPLAVVQAFLRLRFADDCHVWAT